jgi:hypothetical protein
MRRFFCGILIAATLGACPAQRERPVPPVDPRDAQLAQLKHEKETLTAERDEAYQSSAELDATLRGVEADLGALTGIDADIGKTRHDLETGIATQPVRRNTRRMMERLRKMLQQRRGIVDRAQKGIAKANQQTQTVNDRLRKRYIEQISQLQTLITQQVAENARLRDERDEFAKKYAAAASEAKDAHEKVAAISTELDQERAERAEAEREKNRVLVLVAKTADLYRKGIVTGHLFQHKTAHCTCTDCFTEYDRRELKSLPVPGPLRKARLYTTHPRESFILRADGPAKAVLEIIDPEKFWSSARCAVMGY